MKDFIRILSFLTITSIFTSCNTSYFEKDIENFVWEGELKTPIGNARVTVSELLYQLNIKDDINEDDTGHLVFTYTDTLKSNSDIIDISVPRTTIEAEIVTPQKVIQDLEQLNLESVEIPENSPLIQNINTEKETVVTPFNFDGMDISSADFSDGNISITLTSTFGFDADLHILIPSISNKQSNQPYNNTIYLESNSSKIVNIPLNEYTGDFTYNEFGKDNTTNSIVTEIEADFYLREGDIITKTGTIIYTAEIENANTNVIYGDFKDKNFSQEKETFSFSSPYSDIENSTIDFTNSTLKLDIKNGFGFPLGIDVSHIKSYNETDESILTYSGIQNQNNVFDSQDKIVIEGILDINDSPKTMTRVLNNANSNFHDLLAIRPTTFELELSGNLNPEELDFRENFYDKINKGIEVAMTMDIPLDVNFDDVVLEQEIKPFTINEDISIIKNIQFISYISNNIPLSGTLNFEFLNNGIPINVSQSSIQFESAPIDQEGRSSGINAKKYFLDFNKEDLTKLEEITHYQTSITLNTPKETDYVKLLKTNYLELNISSIIDISTEDYVIK